MKDILKYKLASYLYSDSFDTGYLLKEELRHNGKFREPTVAEINRMDRAKDEICKKLTGE
jgi:hypothetical protein